MRSTRCRETVGRRKAGLYSCPMDPVVHIPFAGHRAALRGDYSSQQPKWQGACKGWRITAPKGLMKVTDPQHIQAMSMVLWFPRWNILEKYRKVYFDVSSNSLCFLFLAEIQWHWECPLLARVASPTFWSRSMASPYPRTASVDSCCAKSGVGSTPFWTFSKRIQEVKLCTYSQLIAAASQCQSNPIKAFEWLGVQRCFNDACRNARRNSPRHGLHRPWSGWFQLLPSCKRIWKALAVTGIQDGCSDSVPLDFHSMMYERNQKIVSFNFCRWCRRFLTRPARRHRWTWACLS